MLLLCCKSSGLDKVSVRLMARCVHAICHAHSPALSNPLLAFVDVLTAYTYLSFVIVLMSLLLDLSTSGHLPTHLQQL